jgi:UDP-N-acetylmuramate--alanine ligase
MIAHIMGISDIPASAFLGGISKNLNSNLMLTENPEFIVVEADEYDRSFHQLYPEIAVVTAIDPDHLDIYGNYENILAAFRKFVAQIKKGGSLIHKQGLPLEPIEGVKSFSYALQGMADFRAENIRQKKYNYIFDVMSPFGLEKDIELGLYGKLNLENAIAAYAACAIAGVAPHIIKAGLKTYQGIKRRFDVLVEQDNLVYIDDYAHHPEELRAFISSVRTTFKGLRICGIFQPHLYSRTRDFDVEFAQSLSLLDDVILLPIYPAREEAIPGVDSGIIFNKLDNQGKRILCSKEELAGIVRNLQFEVLLTMGAGDIDMLVEEIKETIEEGKT